VCVCVLGYARPDHHLDHPVDGWRTNLRPCSGERERESVCVCVCVCVLGYARPDHHLDHPVDGWRTNLRLCPGWVNP